MQQLFEPYRQSGQPAFNKSQRDRIYDATTGIPLIIKHCFGQHCEYSKSLDQILENLKNAGNKVMDLSFSEIFNLLNGDTQGKSILILL
jgi:hypothetical protein